MFEYTEIEKLGDLERLGLALDGIDDEKLMQKLDAKRKNGRDDYPLRVMWNLLIALIVFEHKKVASFRRSYRGIPSSGENSAFAITGRKNTLCRQAGCSAGSSKCFQKKRKK